MRNLYRIQISGRDIKRFIRTLYKMNVQFYALEEDRKTCIIEVNKDDYEKIQNMKTIYEIELLDTKGVPKLFSLFQKYKIFLASLLFGGVLLYGMTHVILEVEVIHNKQEVRSLIEQELSERGIRKFQFVKSFNRQEQIVDDVLKKYRDTIEWMEIERIGTKYVIKVEERKKITSEEEKKPRDIVAAKDGIILSIEAKSGEVISKKNSYVKKGDLLITGTIKNQDKTKAKIAAEGKIFAETWYHINVELPFFYKEETKTGKEKKRLSFFFLQKEYIGFPFSSYEHKKETTLWKLGNRLFPFGIRYTKEEEIDLTDVLYTKEQAVLTATEIASERLKEKLGKEDEIISRKSLKITEEDSKIIVELFYRVKEDITSYQEIFDNEVQTEE